MDESRILEAQKSLQTMLGRDSLSGTRFLDAGCGSGLFSLAARRLGATVASFDYDAEAVACTQELRRRFQDGDTDWSIVGGSVLDPAFIDTLGQFDVVYSWGVLHHTGAMWNALAGVMRAVAPSGRLFIALYNDQGLQSRIWTIVKRTHNRLPGILRPTYCGVIAAALESAALGAALVRRRPVAHIRSRLNYRSRRGMSWWRDMVDWVGGYPFEVARPEQVTAFCRDRGFAPETVRTVGRRLGCNEFVFVRAS
ncbi:MAG TPA: class I SAM-dependent methyltransferase [Vicinamibacterales bacterium]|nr:class I SAM-dependent methyltransferase [Vicinamibacterales bacterium]